MHACIPYNAAFGRNTSETVARSRRISYGITQDYLTGCNGIRNIVTGQDGTGFKFEKFRRDRKE